MDKHKTIYDKNGAVLQQPLIFTVFFFVYFDLHYHLIRGEPISTNELFCR